MKIGFDAKRLFANATGLGNYSRSLVHNLQHFHPENEYHLFTPEADKNGLGAAFLSSDKFHVHQSKARLKAYWRSFSITKDLQKTGIDLYHGLSNELPYNLQKTGIKSVVTIHDLIFKTFPETYSLSERIVYDRKFRYACEHADKIVAISENTKQDIIRFYGIDEAKIEVIYQTCNPIFYTLRTQAENQAVAKEYNLPSQYFLYVGSVEQRKNLKLIIEAYRLKQSDLNIPLIIIGKGGAYMNECKKLIEQYGLQDKFIWQSKLGNNTHLQSIYQNAQALIYPSFYEGFGLPLAEALFCKTPVITADTSSLREAGGPHSIYIHPNDNAAMADAMLRLIAEPELAETMRNKGYEYAHATFGTQKLTDQMSALYNSITSK